MFSEEELRQFNEGNAALDEWIDALEDGKPANATYKAIVRCNRGACTGTINPVSGRCLHCNQTPLKKGSGEETEAPLVPATRVFERAEWDSFSSDRIKGRGKK